MLLFVLLMDLPFQILFLSPIILWSEAAHHWRPEIALGGVIMWGTLGWLIWRRLKKSADVERAEFVPQGDWRWPKRMTAATFAEDFRLYLYNHGWRNVTVRSIAADAVTMTLQKDRLTLVLECRRGGSEPTRQDVESMVALREQAHCSDACLATDMRSPAALHVFADARRVRLLAMAELEFVDSLAMER